MSLQDVGDIKLEDELSLTLMSLYGKDFLHVSNTAKVVPHGYKKVVPPPFVSVWSNLWLISERHMAGIRQHMVYNSLRFS